MENVTNLKDHQDKSVICKDKDVIEFLNKSLKQNISIDEFARIFLKIRNKYKDIKPFNRKRNNYGAINLASDPATSAMERKTNAIDGRLDYLFNTLDAEKQKIIKTPRDAVKELFNINAEEGLKSLSTKERFKIAKETSIIRYLEGDGKDRRILDVIDNGIGIKQEDFEKTILSIGEDNKLDKLHLMGQFGQGGSSTFKFAEYTLIASKHYNSDLISFTIVWHDEPKDEERVKAGSYVYITHNELPFAVEAKEIDKQIFQQGTIVRHFGYDLTKYTSARGQNSLYLTLQKTLFDPPLPIYFMNIKDKYNRTIKGTRAALLGGLDPEDSESKLNILHSEPIASKKIRNGDLGSIKIEYWVVKKEKSYWDPKTKKRIPAKKPLHSHIDRYKPIIFTHNGQNQYELGNSLIKREMGLEYLAKESLVIHVNCDDLSLRAKRKFFNSTRESATEGISEYASIIDSLVEHIRSDEELERLNAKAAEELANDDESISKEDLQKDIAKFIEATGGLIDGITGPTDQPSDVTGPVVRRPRINRVRPRPIKKEIKLNEPPTYINFLWESDEIKFYNSQERYLRIVTDANSNYEEKISIEIDDNFSLVSRTKLTNGRMRICLRCNDNVKIGQKGKISIKLKCDQSNIDQSDSKNYIIKDVPKEISKSKPMIPNINIKEVNGIEDENWEQLFDDYDNDPEKNNESGISFHYKKIDTADKKCINVYYNNKYQPFVNTLSNLTKSNSVKHPLLVKKYRTFLMCVAYLQIDQENKKDKSQDIPDLNSENEKVVFAMQSKFKKSAATAALLLAKNFVLNKETD